MDSSGFIHNFIKSSYHRKSLDDLNEGVEASPHHCRGQEQHQRIEHYVVMANQTIDGIPAETAQHIIQIHHCQS